MPLQGSLACYRRFLEAVKLSVNIYQKSITAWIVGFFVGANSGIHVGLTITILIVMVYCDHLRTCNGRGKACYGRSKMVNPKFT